MRKRPPNHNRSQGAGMEQLLINIVGCEWGLWLAGICALSYTKAAMFAHCSARWTLTCSIFGCPRAMVQAQLRANRYSCPKEVPVEHVILTQEQSTRVQQSWTSVLVIVGLSCVRAHRNSRQHVFQAPARGAGKPWRIVLRFDLACLVLHLSKPIAMLV